MMFCCYVWMRGALSALRKRRRVNPPLTARQGKLHESDFSSAAMVLTQTTSCRWRSSSTVTRRNHRKNTVKTTGIKVDLAVGVGHGGRRHLWNEEHATPIRSADSRSCRQVVDANGARSGSTGNPSDVQRRIGIWISAPVKGYLPQAFAYAIIPDFRAAQFGHRPDMRSSRIA